MGILIDAYSDTVSKYGEELCGDKVEIIRSTHAVAAMLADGQGSGVKASMLATLAVGMLKSMLHTGEPIEEIVDMLVDSQYDTGKQEVSYCAFTIIRVSDAGQLYIAQMDTPEIIFLRHGKPIPIEMNCRTVKGRIIRTARTVMKASDTVIAFSSGVASAGAGGFMKKGWQRDNITAYMVNAYRPGITAEKLTKLLLAAGSSLYHDKADDDMAVLTVRVNKGKSDGI